MPVLTEAPDRPRAPARDAPDRQAAARDVYRESLRHGTPLTGAELGARYDRSPRWGRIRKAEVKAEDGVSPNLPSPRSQRPVGSGAVPARASTNGNRSDNRSDNGNGNGAVPARASTNGNHSGGQPAEGEGQAFDSRPGARGHLAQPLPMSEAAVNVRRSWADLGITLAVALVAAAASYGHMLDVALTAGEPLLIARAFPVTVDGLVLAALRCGERGRWWLGLGVAVSVGANVLAQFPDVAEHAGPIISAWPPVALYGTHRLLQKRVVGSRWAGTAKGDER